MTWSRLAGWLVVVAVLSYAGSRLGSPRLGYMPQAGAVENPPAQGVRTAILPFEDATGFVESPAEGLRRINLAREGSSAWPAVTPKFLAETLAGELSRQGLSSEAQVLPDEAAAMEDGADLLIEGRVAEADWTYKDPVDGTLAFELELRGSLRSGPDGNFSIPIWNKTARVEIKYSGGRPSEDINAALSKLYGQALESFSRALEENNRAD